ncbi:hypothetical protein [Lentimicrobium sp. S6]|uniref:hypothetical protein n=1 Tax=Lentimicrobium sp. S6 TaxID=2735872 RepID=UPI00155519CB|nr:hypothetical protein [Lentimicrobium sp. S6]NPD47492.1 hypothetical protein [Lentimicrobium sp. S6]
MSAKKSNQKWIFIGVAVVALLALAFWYFTKEEEGKQISNNETNSIPGYSEPGEAESISDLSPACKKNYEGWAKWVKTNKTWYDQIKEMAKKESISITKGLERTYLSLYNKGEKSC